MPDRVPPGPSPFKENVFDFGMAIAHDGEPFVGLLPQILWLALLVLYLFWTLFRQTGQLTVRL